MIASWQAACALGDHCGASELKRSTDATVDNTDKAINEDSKASVVGHHWSNKSLESLLNVCCSVTQLVFTAPAVVGKSVIYLLPLYTCTWRASSSSLNQQEQLIWHHDDFAARY